jgi:hypothetical protein
VLAFPSEGTCTSRRVKTTARNSARLDATCSPSLRADVDELASLHQVGVSTLVRACVRWVIDRDGVEEALLEEAERMHAERRSDA